MTTTPKKPSFSIAFLEPSDTMLFGMVEAGQIIEGDKKVLQPFIDNGKAEKVGKTAKKKEEN